MKLAVFEERHANGKKHFHVALKLSSESRWVGFKLALRSRSGLASHWSPSHTQFWSIVRYCHFTTPTKTAVDPAPLSWAAGGASLNLHEESQEPFNAVALRARHEQRERNAHQPAAAPLAKHSGDIGLNAASPITRRIC